MNAVEKKTQTIDQAIEAIVAAGHKPYGTGSAVRFYDPRKRGAYVTLDGGYRDAEFSDYVEAKPNASSSKGGPSGEFCAQIRKILEAQRKAM
jgi:hypothetical protein